MPDPIIMTILSLCAVAAILLGLILRRMVLGSRPQREEELRTTLYSIGDAVIGTDERGFVRQMNPIAERLTGWKEQEARGRSLSEVFVIAHELSRVRMENPVARVLREGAVVGLANHTVLIARDGTERPIADSGAPIRGPDGSIRGVVLVFRDQSAERAAARALEASQEKYRLLVEDDEAVRRLTATILESGGYTVLPAANGAEALQKLAAVDRPLDLLITDVVMPGMDGSEVAHKVSSRFPSVAVLYISGYTEDAIVHNGVLDPEVEFIQKPLDGTTLLAKVRSILDRP
jgi:PAS domain S-box-containing protein